jgi:MerR family transcriptional regulator/heat shock protein HspR
MPFMAGRDGAWEADDRTPLYVISVAAELTGLHAQTLRQYDRLGLVSPGRTPGGGRRYSRRDIAQLREVVRLSSLGLGLEGVRQVLDLENQVAALQGRVRELQDEVDHLRAALDSATPRTALVVWRPDQRR